VVGCPEPTTPTLQLFYSITPTLSPPNRIAFSPSGKVIVTALAEGYGGQANR
jgi:hypothetical protein